MPRKRTRRLTLVLLGSAGLLTTGCSDKVAVAPGAELHPAAKLDEATAKRIVTQGSAAAYSDAFLHATSLLASGPAAGFAAPLYLAKVAYTTDQAVETFEVTSNAAQLPGLAGVKNSTGTNTSQYPPRAHYHYSHGPGVGWFLFGYMMGRSTSNPYVPPRNYAPTPRPINPSVGNRSSFGHSGGTTRGGSVGRGGFGGSGGAHASGGGGS